jgi:hypothetical protein
MTPAVEAYLIAVADFDEAAKTEWRARARIKHVTPPGFSIDGEQIASFVDGGIRIDHYGALTMEQAKALATWLQEQLG